MRILVTGAKGFIGSHLCPELSAHGHEVVPVDREEGDLRGSTTAMGLLVMYEPELVVHLAAKVGRLFGEEDLAETVSSNITATGFVAKACGEADVRLAYVSTSEVYGDGDIRTWEEPDLYLAHPHNAYGLTKRQGEEFCRLYAPKDLVVMRLSMPYGPGLPPGIGRAALVTFLDCASRRVPVTVHRDSERSWCYVGDTVRGMRMILESGESGNWNVGRSDNSIPMRKVAEMACDLVGAPHSLIREIDAPERQTVIKRLGTLRLHSLGWKPEVELEQGMERTRDWLEQRGDMAA